MAKESIDFVQRGDWGEVRHAIRTNGSMEAKEWLDEAGESAQSKFDLFRKISGVGKIFNEQHFRLLEDGIWEFKRDGNRVLCFQRKLCWLLTHHFNKSGQKCPKQQIERAKKIREEHLARIQRKPR